MPRFPIGTIALLALAHLLAACATGPTISSQSDPGADLDAYASFTLLPLPDFVEGADPGAMLRLKGPIEEQLRAGLLAGKYGIESSSSPTIGSP